MAAVSRDKRKAKVAAGAPSSVNDARTDGGNPVVKGGTQSPGDRMEYVSLSAGFTDDHQVYYDLLARAIATDGVKNVAITGAYGTGKSSVLAKLEKEKAGKAVQLSLSTIAAPDRMGEGAGVGESLGATNLIQKEIVKQLLYRLPPSQTPRSRFRRASKAKRGVDWFVAGVVGVVVVGIPFLLGLLQLVVERVIPGPAVRWWATYVLLVGLVAVAVWAVRRLITGRVSMSASLGTGMTTVTLSEKSDTYFDEYLDEIVYFFQVSDVEIVVIEDIDRFKDVEVFDTLRALNGLLNGAGGLSRIVFVYAIRDSVFERIGDVSEAGEGSDPAARAIALASRTKFFDVIIPVVPFLSADNARDLMSRVMASPVFTISPKLIRTAARHTADMRLIHNIRNEFEVYRNQLIAPKDRLYGIDDDLVFAMVLYKNTHLGDFEKIRHKASSLDDLYGGWRRLVRSNLKVELRKLAGLRARVIPEEVTVVRIRHLADLVLSRRDALLGAHQLVHGVECQVALGGVATEETIRDYRTWTQIAAGAELVFVFTDRWGRPASTMTFAGETLGGLLGVRIDADEWAEVDRAELDRQVAACEERIRTLRHHTWEELCARADFTVTLGSVAITFDQLVDRHLQTDLAKELVRKGYITDHFALYTSTYYGVHLGPDAREYVHRCIRPGEPDAVYKLTVEAVQQILLDQDAADDDDADVFEDPSLFNVSIVDYLLGERPSAAKKVARKLAVWGDAEAEFVDTYCAQGNRPDLLLAAMAPHWKGVVQYAAAGASFPSELDRVSALNAVLTALPTAAGYLADERVGDVIEASYPGLVAVTDPVDGGRAAIVFDVVASSSAVVGAVGAFNDHAREAVTARARYMVTEENLRELTGSASIALDELRKVDDRIYTHVLRHLDDYLVAFAGSPSTTHTIKAVSQFVGVVNDAAAWATDPALEALVLHAVACQVVDLTTIADASWPCLLRGDRVKPTFFNFDAYVAEYGVNEALAAFLDLHPRLEWDEATAPGADRVAAAVQVINAREVIPDVGARVTIAAHLRPGELDVQALKPEPGELPARLIEAGLLADDVATFASSLMTDWATRESAIRASASYEQFIDVQTLPVADVPKLLTSRLRDEVKNATVRNLEALLAGATRAEAQAIADALNLKGWRVLTSRIQALINRGVGAPAVIALIARNDGLTLDAQRALLRTMGGDYARLADVGERPVFLRDDQDHRRIVASLQDATVSSYAPDKRKADVIRVNLRKTER